MGSSKELDGRSPVKTLCLAGLQNSTKNDLLSLRLFVSSEF